VPRMGTPSQTKREGGLDLAGSMINHHTSHGPSERCAWTLSVGRHGQQGTDFYTFGKLIEAGNGLEPRPVEGGHRTWEAYGASGASSGHTTKMEVVLRLCF
jgi:hypothetical protein